MILLDGHRVGVAVGRCPDLPRSIGLRSRVAAALRETADPARALDGLDPLDGTIVCAVIDRAASQFVYSSLGEVTPVLAAPNLAHRLLEHADRRVATATLPPGATLLLCSDPDVGSAAAELDDCAHLHPDVAADRIVGLLSPPAAVICRHPPGPLVLTVPAEPASLATVRARLRQWLSLAGIDPESSADSLLAVGEAASNATEHSVLGADHGVQITVQAVLEPSGGGEQMRFTVSDNGRWKPAAPSPGYRGHGIRLINALVDETDLTATDDGTTVEMLKEVRS